MIELNDISYVFGEHIVFDHVSFALPERGLVALTGPNGIGKTTLLRVLGGLYRSHVRFPYVGYATYLDAEFLTLDMLTVDEMVTLLSCQRNVDADLLRDSSLLDARMRDTRIAGLSLGQRQRLVIATAAALTSPKLLLLDEPFNGLDHEASIEAHRWIRRTAERRTVLFATHDQRDAENYATHRLHISGPSDVVVSGPDAAD